MESETTETNESETPTNSLTKFLFSTRLHSVTSPPFQPNEANIFCMDSSETCAYCGKELVSGRCLRCGYCERCGA
jgi:hypothetical protein